MILSSFESVTKLPSISVLPIHLNKNISPCTGLLNFRNFKKIFQIIHILNT